MLIYRVLDESDTPVGDYSSYQKALLEAEEMTLCDEDHRYRVASIQVEALETLKPFGVIENLVVMR